jgi:hypothetical protein
LGETYCFAARDSGVSWKLNHSNSRPALGMKPASWARATIFFRRERGQTGSGPPRPSSKSARKNGTPPSQGTVRAVDRSTRATASGYPVCQPVYVALS